MGDSPNLAWQFGMNEYAVYTVEQGVHKRSPALHYTQKDADVKEGLNFEYARMVTATGVVRDPQLRVGVQRFWNTYEQKSENELLVTIEREYTDKVTVFDDSVCFLCTPGWYNLFKLYSPEGEYYNGYYVPRNNPVRVLHSEEAQQIIFDTKKTLEEQNLFSKAIVEGWGEIWGNNYGLRFDILEFSKGEFPIQRIVQPKNRSYVEYEFQFDLLGERQAGDIQRLKLLITGLVAQR